MAEGAAPSCEPPSIRRWSRHRLLVRQLRGRRQRAARFRRLRALGLRRRGRCLGARDTPEIVPPKRSRAFARVIGSARRVRLRGARRCSVQHRAARRRPRSHPHRQHLAAARRHFGDRLRAARPGLRAVAAASGQSPWRPGRRGAGSPRAVRRRVAAASVRPPGREPPNRKHAALRRVASLVSRAAEHAKRRSSRQGRAGRCLRAGSLRFGVTSDM